MGIGGGEPDNAIGIDNGNIVDPQRLELHHFMRQNKTNRAPIHLLNVRQAGDGLKRADEGIDILLNTIARLLR
jgi:hypothetical protein